MKILVTGGCGFIGSALVRFLLKETDATVLNVDNLTYAANKASLTEVEGSSRYHFFKGDICDRQLLNVLFNDFKPDAVMNLAAESHVDRSIHSPGDFIRTNIIGTYVLLETARAYWQELPADKLNRFRFHHISTDEVYGDLEGSDKLFVETTPYCPSSPYSASKAGSDHLVRAWHRTYGLPVVLTNCSNNYGPRQFPEKLIPLMITNALAGKWLPVYGDGRQIRDWLYVEDHVRALWEVVTRGRVGETYNIGGNNEITNIEVVTTLCELLDERHPNGIAGIGGYRAQIKYVRDRAGHDRRYAIDAGKVARELGWQPRETFGSGLAKTVDWYLGNGEWLNAMESEAQPLIRLKASGESPVTKALNTWSWRIVG